MQIPSYGQTVFYLFRSEFKIFLRTIHDKLIDLFIWIVISAFVNIYLMAAFGVHESFGAFTIASMVASAGLFEQFSSVTTLIADLEGNSVTSYYLTLPLPSWLVFVTYMAFYAFNSAILAMCVLPACKLLFWNHLDLSQFSLLKYLLIFKVTALFYGAFTLWVAGKVPSLERIGSVWMRFIFPLWFLGAFQYPLDAMTQLSDYFWYASLLNPMVYIMEGTRAAILGQEGYLNFWFCVVMTVIFTVICAADGIRMLKKRLDYV